MAPVKRRAYDSSRRREQARQNRLAVLAAAREMFLARGYAATTMAEVADEATVSVETIYKAFGKKPGLLKAVLDVAIVGDDEPIPLLERDLVRRIEETTDPREKLRIYGAHLASSAPRRAPIELLARAAAVTDAEAAELWEQMRDERLTGMTHFARHLHECGYLRPEVSLEDARDVLWTLISAELFDLLVIQRGWPPERYGQWVADVLLDALMSDRSGGRDERPRPARRQVRSRKSRGRTTRGST